MGKDSQAAELGLIRSVGRELQAGWVGWMLSVCHP